MSGNLAPLPIWQFLDQNGHPIAGGSVTYYQAGTQNKVTIYADIALDTPLPNPITLDSAGRPATGSGPTPIWFDPSRAYKQVVLDAQGDVIWTADNIVSPGTGVQGPPGPPGPSGSVNTNYGEGEWTPSLVSTVDSSGGIGTIYATQWGHWTRIGRLVFVTGRLVLSHLGTWNNALLMIGGLPFQVAAPNGFDTYDIGAVTITGWRHINPDFQVLFGTALNAPQGLALMGKLTGFADSEWVNQTNLHDDSEFSFTGFYQTSEEPPTAEDELTTNEQVIGDGGSITLPDGFSQHIIYCSNSNLLVLTGALMTAKVGTRLIIVSAGTGPVFLAGDSGVHPGAFVNPVFTGPIPLNGGGVAEYIFSPTDGNRWLLVSHRQGLPIATPWSPSIYATFDGTPGSTWTVDAPNIVAQQYELIGVHIRVWIQLAGTTFTGAGGALAIDEIAWGGYRPTRNNEMAGMCIVTQGNAHDICWMRITSNNHLWIENLTGAFQTSTIGLDLMAEFEVS